MPLISEPELRRLAADRRQRLRESTDLGHRNLLMKAAALSHYDIFLSHSFRDKDLILGIAELFETFDYTVYLDWREDSRLDRATVNRETANTLKRRMSNSSALFFVPTDHAIESKWMPWELGFMDGKNGKAAVFPVTQVDSGSSDYRGQEYLGIYPYATVGKNRAGDDRIWIRQDRLTSVTFERWLKGEQPKRRQ